jgi:hypothetical protein
LLRNRCRSPSEHYRNGRLEPHKLGDSDYRFNAVAPRFILDVVNLL